MIWKRFRPDGTMRTYIRQTAVITAAPPGYGQVGQEFYVDTVIDTDPNRFRATNGFFQFLVAKP